MEYYIRAMNWYSYVLLPSGRGRLTLTLAAELARPK